VWTFLRWQIIEYPHPLPPHPGPHALPSSSSRLQDDSFFPVAAAGIPPPNRGLGHQLPSTPHTRTSWLPARASPRRGTGPLAVASPPSVGPFGSGERLGCPLPAPSGSGEVRHEVATRWCCFSGWRWTAVRVERESSTAACMEPAASGWRRYVPWDLLASEIGWLYAWLLCSSGFDFVAETQLTCICSWLDLGVQIERATGHGGRLWLRRQRRSRSASGGGERASRACDLRLGRVFFGK
jgi:hypothetical protein